MKTRKLRKSDPDKMFQVAEAFLALCTTAKTPVNLGNPNILPLVLGTNVAFALETYLKCLRVIEFGEYFEGHDLKTLYDDLGDDTKREIERRHTLCEPHLSGLAAAQGTAVRTDLHSLLVAGKDAFTDFGYAYEKIPAGTVWGLDALMLIVKHLILEKQPALQSLQLNQTPSPHTAC